MQPLFRLVSATTNEDGVNGWLREQKGELGLLARCWFEVLRTSGTEVCELLHDDRPTVCFCDAAFAYIDVYSRHMNIGFFYGAELNDPNKLLQGTGKMMRHIQVRTDDDIDENAIVA